MKRKIPVFYHIPKNAGTYVSDWFMIAFRHYRRTYTDWLKNYSPEKDSIKCIQIIEDGFIIARVLVGDPNYFCDTHCKFINAHSNTKWDIDLKDITNELLNNVFLFGIIIESNGFKQRKAILDLFYNYNLHQFLILRDPFSRAQSIYNYNKSEESKHDYVHGKMISATFKEHILSEQLEDSWLIRELTSIEDVIPLGEIYFNQTKIILDDFKVYGIKDTDKAIQEAFLECYSFDTKQIELKPWDKFTKNESVNKKVKFEELSEEAQKVFTERTCWDNELYKTFAS